LGVSRRKEPNEDVYNGVLLGDGLLGSLTDTENAPWNAYRQMLARLANSSGISNACPCRSIPARPLVISRTSELQASSSRRELYHPRASPILTSLRKRRRIKDSMKSISCLGCGCLSLGVQGLTVRQLREMKNARIQLS
jgi:hypothetical protein